MSTPGSTMCLGYLVFCYGSTGLSVVNAFFETNGELMTDEDRKTFAKDGLKDLKFIYSNMDAEDPRVLYLIVCPLMNKYHWLAYQLFKGLFCGPLVLQTFAAHFNAINGVVKVAGLKDEQVQIALTLWATGKITVQMVLNAKSLRCTKSHTKGHCNFTLPKTFIHDNGTEESTTFSDITWSRATSKYMEFVTTALWETCFDKIIEKARGMMASMHRLQVDNTIDINSYDDVQLVDLSDEDCKFWYINIHLHCTKTYKQSILWDFYYSTYTNSCLSLLSFLSAISPLSYMSFLLHAGFNSHTSIVSPTVWFNLYLMYLLLFCVCVHVIISYLLVIQVT